MDRLTKEEIEAVWEIVYRRYVDTTPNVYYAMVQRMRAPFDLALQSLESVRSEARNAALEEAARMCEESAKILRGNGLRREDDALSITAKSIRALKREPNAAAQGSTIDGGQVDAFNTGPAAAAPAMELWAWWRMTPTGAVAFVGKEPPDKINIWSPLYRRALSPARVAEEKDVDDNELRK